MASQLDNLDTLDDLDNDSEDTLDLDSLSDGQKLLQKQRKIEELLEQRRLEKELRDSFDDLDDEFYDTFDEL